MYTVSLSVYYADAPGGDVVVVELVDEDVAGVAVAVAVDTGCATGVGRYFASFLHKWMSLSECIFVPGLVVLDMFLLSSSNDH